MPFDPSRHHRRSVRLPGYDYAGPGLYLVTICTHGRACLFGEVEGEAMRLQALGEIAKSEWERTVVVRPNVILDAFVVMPNHVHLLFGILDTGRGTPAVCPYGEPRGFGRSVAGSVATIMRQYKSLVTKRVNALRATPGAPVWQRGYHERVVRNDREVSHIRRYIAENPLRWRLDRYHPTRPG